MPFIRYIALPQAYTLPLRAPILAQHARICGLSTRALWFLTALAAMPRCAMNGHVPEMGLSDGIS
jgi:hypothetical protein